MNQPMVWVVGPDPDACHLIALNLSRRGMQVVEMWARDLPVSSWAKPDLLIVDAPDEAGWSLIQNVRASAWAERVPMIVLVAVEPSASQLSAIQPAQWMIKPLDIDQLLTRVRTSVAQISDAPPKSI